MGSAGWSHLDGDLGEELILALRFFQDDGQHIGQGRLGVTTLGKRVYSESLAETKDPWGRTVYWIGGGHISWSGGEDSDFQAVEDGYISITPLHVDLTNYNLLEDVQAWRLAD